MKRADWYQQNQTSIVTLLLLVGGTFLMIMTKDAAIDLPINWLAAFIILGSAAAFYAWIIAVKFYSYLIITENYRTTTFHPHVQLLYDEGWAAFIALVRGGGWNAPSRLLSYSDLSTTGHVTELFVVMDPFMVEEVGNEHFILIRGRSTECGIHEKAAFLARPSVKQALLDAGIKGVGRLHFVLGSTSLHPDTTIDDLTSLDDVAAVLGQMQHEIEDVNVRTEERLNRALRTVDQVRFRRKSSQPPQLPQPPQKKEEKDEQ